MHSGLPIFLPSFTPGFTCPKTILESCENYFTRGDGDSTRTVQRTSKDGDGDNLSVVIPQVEVLQLK